MTAALAAEKGKGKVEWFIAISVAIGMFLMLFAVVSIELSVLFTIGMFLLGAECFVGGFALLGAYSERYHNVKVEYLKTIRAEWQVLPVSVFMCAAGFYLGYPVVAYAGFVLYILKFMKHYLY
jgi:hypothetical protein